MLYFRQDFVQESLRYLWTRVSPLEHGLVRRRALEAISKFPMKDQQLKMLPEVVSFFSLVQFWNGLKLLLAINRAQVFFY